MILGIESSCDDSSVALIDERTLEQILWWRGPRACGKASHKGTASTFK